jgi:NitT/TauT family transport system permease protein
VLIVYGAEETTLPLSTLDVSPVSLDPSNLPHYALRTTMRMLLAIVCSIIFTFVYAALAAKSRRAEMVLIPLLDILQSVPILGFLTFTVVFFLNLFPGRVFGAELACVFAIFTSQAWNMTFSMYQSIRNVPKDLEEASRSFHLSGWQRFWRLDVPFAMPGLIWNTMMSMSGGWFFVVASEAVSVGNTTFKLPGIGSWLALAIEEKDIGAVALAVATMAAVILAYDQLVFRPIVAWADKFRFEQTAAQQRPQSWVYDIVRRAQLFKRIFALFDVLCARMSAALPRQANISLPAMSPRVSRATDLLWIAAVFAGAAFALWHIVDYMRATLGPADVLHAFALGMLTLTRVVVLIAIASVIWVPISVWIGLRPWAAEKVQPLAQFLAAFPANVLFPIAVVAIVRLHLNSDVWLSPLMVLGTQWYIVFNVIAGASAFPTDLREASTIYQLRSWQWWREVMLPGIFPYYVTGALTASGGSWNASIVAEVASWSSTKLSAAGLGAFIAQATEAGDYPRVVLGIAVMSIMVVAFNRVLWRPLYRLAERRFRLN